MAKRRGTNLSLDTLMAELKGLDTRRTQLVGMIQNAVSSLVGGGTSTGAARRGRPAGSKNKTAGKPRRKMSAKARKAISDAQKRRWAKQKGTKGAEKK